MASRVFRSSAFVGHKPEPRRNDVAGRDRHATQMEQPREHNVHRRRFSEPRLLLGQAVNGTQPPDDRPAVHTDDATSRHDALQCLDRVRGGYCTNLCETDADCCAVAGECETNLKQVRSPFESTGQKMCFLSCEDEDIAAATAAHGLPDAGDAGDAGDPATLYCQTFAAPNTTCRSSGGGSSNRKVCIPQ